MTLNSPLAHGGNIETARREFGGARDDWLDLSTGISPWHYPIPDLACELWHKLPNEPDKLREIAAQYYGCAKNMLVISQGSQLAIRLIPTLIEPRQTVAVPQLGYQEHRLSWQLAKHKLLEYRNETELNELIQQKRVQNVVVINPNNPTTEKFSIDTLLALASKISGVMLVDEAFADLDPNCSLLGRNAQPESLSSNIIVLRSLGKFFGLAGARIGFVISNNSIIKELQQLISPWPVSGPSQTVAELALADRKWQRTQRIRIQQQAQIVSQEISAWASNFAELEYRNSGLFSTFVGPKHTIKSIHSRFAEHCVWTRIGEPFANTQSTQSFTHLQNWLRLSLPGDQLNTFTTTLQTIKTYESS